MGMGILKTIWNIVWRILSAVLALIGFAGTPDDVENWGNFIAFVAPYFNAELVQYLSIGLFGLLIANVSIKAQKLYEGWKNKKNSSHMSEGSFRQIDLNRVALPNETHEDEYISLRESSVKTYSALRKKNRRLVKDIDQHEDTEEGKLSYIANAISLCINVYGKYPPSEELELIPHKSSSIWNYINGGNVLQENGLMEDIPRYIDCAIKKEDLKQAIEVLGGEE